MCKFRSINQCTSICTSKMIICLICTCIPLYITVFKGLPNPHHKRLTTSPDWLKYTLNYFLKVKVQYNKYPLRSDSCTSSKIVCQGIQRVSTKKQSAKKVTGKWFATHVRNNNTCRLQMAMVTRRLCVLEVIEHPNHREYDWMPRVWLCIQIITHV